MFQDEEERAALWRMQRRQLMLGKLAQLRSLMPPPGPYLAVREAWRPVELAIAESRDDSLDPVEALEDESNARDRRNPFGCLIP